MEAFTVHDVFKIARFTAITCVVKRFFAVPKRLTVMTESFATSQSSKLLGIYVKYWSAVLDMHFACWVHFHGFSHSHQTHSALQHAKEAVTFEKTPCLWVRQLLQML
jgi:hypothetical protein